jgi:hypothetical protein
MLADLESMYTTLLNAFKAVVLLSGVDLDALAATDQQNPPTCRVPF